MNPEVNAVPSENKSSSTDGGSPPMTVVVNRPSLSNLPVRLLSPRSQPSGFDTPREQVEDLTTSPSIVINTGQTIQSKTPNLVQLGNSQPKGTTQLLSNPSQATGI